MDYRHKPLDVAILGATGAVGQRFIQLLDGHPWFSVVELVASDRSAGRSYAQAARWVLSGNAPEEVAGREVLPLDADLQSRIVFSALPSDVAKTVEWRLAEAGHIVCSNASAYRMAPDVPILLPEINADHAALINVQRQNHGWTTGGLATNSNCTSAPVAMALAPLRPFGIQAAQVVSMQAVSGAGYPGVPSLDIIDNVVPFIGGEEPKVEAEPRKMLGTLAGDHIEMLDCVMSATCTRVPVLDGHMVAVSVRFADSVSEDAIIAAWENFTGPEPVPGLPSAPPQPVVVRSEPDRPQTRRDRDTGGGMATVVGRLRPCPVMGGWKFLAMAHNTVRGAAGCSILNAELLVERGYV
ncbi:MAG: aspartate-semialdehyde dehydrogenase [Anaerolineae bacterium]|nr:aspartate-semialdehyde dehydrogenase [Anaerolineae bacterium]